MAAAAAAAAAATVVDRRDDHWYRYIWHNPHQHEWHNYLQISTVVFMSACVQDTIHQALEPGIRLVQRRRWLTLGKQKAGMLTSLYSWSKEHPW